MLVIGAKGFAIQLTDILVQLQMNSQCVYYDDTSTEPVFFLEKLKVIRNIEDAADYLLNIDKRFVLGVGQPKWRSHFFNLFISKGGTPETIISPFARIGSHNTEIGAGSCILTNAVIESTARLGKGTLINLSATVTHGCSIGDFCEISPGVHISGDCKIGNQTFIGTGAVILPKINIGDNVIIGAGSVITRDIPSNKKVKGVPGKISDWSE
jgi:sugar O-acyltransferase (sialic acid O-acetyltransferase NeuD family)